MQPPVAVVPNGRLLPPVAHFWKVLPAVTTTAITRSVMGQLAEGNKQTKKCNQSQPRGEQPQSIIKPYVDAFFGLQTLPNSV